MKCDKGGGGEKEERRKGGRRRSLLICTFSPHSLLSFLRLFDTEIYLSVDGEGECSMKEGW